MALNTEDRCGKWMTALHNAVTQTEVEIDLPSGGPQYLVGGHAEAVRHIAELGRLGHEFIFAGNGGSLAAAQHFAVDFNLAGWRAYAISDNVAMSSHANDFGTADMFLKQLVLSKWLNSRHVLVCLSTSGESENLVRAAAYARSVHVPVMTFTGRDKKNRLRALGTTRVHVPSHETGIIQLAHECILHMAVDIK